MSVSSSLASSSVLAVVQMHDIHAADLVDLVILDLGEDQLLLDAEAVVASAVEGVGVDTAEVTDTGQSHVEQTDPGTPTSCPDGG